MSRNSNYVISDDKRKKKIKHLIEDIKDSEEKMYEFGKNRLHNYINKHYPNAFELFECLDDSNIELNEVIEQIFDPKGEFSEYYKYKETDLKENLEGIIRLIKNFLGSHKEYQYWLCEIFLNKPREDLEEAVIGGTEPERTESVFYDVFDDLIATHIELYIRYGQHKAGIRKLSKKDFNSLLEGLDRVWKSIEVINHVSLFSEMLIDSIIEYKESVEFDTEFLEELVNQLTRIVRRFSTVYNVLISDSRLMEDLVNFGLENQATEEDVKGVTDSYSTTVYNISEDIRSMVDKIGLEIFQEWDVMKEEIYDNNDPIDDLLMLAAVYHPYFDSIKGFNIDDEMVKNFLSNPYDNFRELYDQVLGELEEAVNLGNSYDIQPPPFLPPAVVEYMATGEIGIPADDEIDCGDIQPPPFLPPVVVEYITTGKVDIQINGKTESGNVPLTTSSQLAPPAFLPDSTEGMEKFRKGGYNIGDGVNYSSDPKNRDVFQR